MRNEFLDPLTAPGLRWGIIGAGFIAGKFTNAVAKHTASEVVAVGSRDRAKAERFAAANGIPDVSVGYEALVSRSDSDARISCASRPAARIRNTRPNRASYARFPRTRASLTSASDGCEVSV